MEQTDINAYIFYGIFGFAAGMLIARYVLFGIILRTILRALGR